MCGSLYVIRLFMASLSSGFLKFGIYKKRSSGILDGLIISEEIFYSLEYCLKMGC